LAATNRKGQGFSELSRKAYAEGPQYVTRAGKETVVVVPAEQFAELVARKRQPKSLVQFFRKSPLRGIKVDRQREHDLGRDVKL
jgi:antitoxin Phd